MFQLQPTRTVRSSLWAVSFCVYTRSILVRADCTTGTQSTRTQIIVVGVEEPQQKISSATDSPTAVAEQEPSAVWPNLHYQKWRRIARAKARTFIRISLSGLQAQNKICGTRRPIRRKRWGACVCPFSRDNHKQPTSSPAGYECYSYLLFLLSPYHFFTIQKDIFLELVTLISNLRGEVTVGNSKSFQRFASGETSPT